MKLSKPSLKLPTVKFPSKRWLLIGAGVVVLLALFTFGVVSQVRAERAQAETARLKQAQAAQLEKQHQAQLDRQTALLTAETAKTAQVCDWTHGIAAKYHTQVPPLCR